MRKRDLPVQENDGGMPLFSEGTCHYFISDQEGESVYFYSRIVGTTFCRKLLLPEVESVLPKCDMCIRWKGCVYDVSLLLLFGIEDPRLVDDAAHVKRVSLAGVFVCNDHLLAVMKTK